MKALRRDARGSLGKAIADTFEKELGEAGYNASEKAGLRAGDGIRDGLNKKLKSDAFSRDIRQSIDKALESLGDTSESTSRRLRSLRKEFDEGGKSANEARNELDRMGESLRRVGANDGNAQVATNARRAAEALLGTSEANRRNGDEAKRAATKIETAGRTVEKANDGAGRSERNRAREFERGVEGNNRVSRSLFSLRNALSGVSGDSQQGANAFRFFNGALLAAVTIGPALIPILAGIAGGLALLLPMLLGVGAGFGVAILGFSGIAGAVKALGDQEKATAKDSTAYQHAVQAAARGVADARRGLADAYRNSAQGIADALDRQKEAEHDLTEAQHDAKAAQEALTQARKDAKAEAQDLADQIAQNQLDERQGVIDLFNAYNQYGAVMSDGGSTNLEREQADIALKQAQLNLKRIREEEKKLADQKKKSDKDGINGAKGVRDAEERLRNALERVHNANLAVEKSTRAVSRARADGARSIADAQRNLTRAQEDYNYALQGGAEQADKLRQAMDQLSPAGQKFARFLFGMKDGLLSLRRDAQERFLPGVQDGLERIISKYGPGFRGFVRGMSSDLGRLSREAGKSFTSKVYTKFFSAFGPASRQFSTDFGHIVLDLLSAFTSIMTPAIPYARKFSTYLARMADSFSKWAASKAGQEKITDFFAFIARVGPRVARFFGAFLTFVVHLGKALEPIGESVLSFVTQGIERLTKIDPKKLTLIAGGILALIAAAQISSGFTSLLTLIALATSGPLIIAISAIASLATAFFFLSRSGGDSQKSFERFTRKLKPLLPIIKDLGGLLRKHLVDIIQNHLLPALKSIGKELTDEFIPAFVRFYPTIRPIIKALLWLFGTILIGAIDGAKNAIIGLLKILTGVMDLIDDLVHGRWGQIWGDLGTIVSGVIHLIIGIIELAPTRMLKYLGRGFKLIGNLFGRLFEKVIPATVRRGMNGLVYIIKHPFKIIQSLFTLWKDGILKTTQKLIEKLPAMLKKIAGFFGKNLGNGVITVTDLVFNKALIGGINKVAGFVGLKGKSGKGILGKIPLPDKFHTGGVVNGPYSPGRDNRIIRVGGGEGILRPEATREIGEGGLKRINNAAIRGGRGAVRKLLGFAKGGVIWPTKSKHWTTYAGHDGLDFNGKGNRLGDPYFATANGKVVYTGTGRGYGNKVELKTAGGPTVIYGHSSKVFASAGDKVKKGQVLGHIGYSGHVIPAGPAGSHLHFGLKGEPADRGAQALKYLHGAAFRGSAFNGIGDKLAGLGKAALAILKNPEHYFRKRIDGGFAKVKGIGGDDAKMLRAAPLRILGGITHWAKSKAHSLLGLPLKFFKGGLGKVKDLAGKLNPLGGSGRPALYDKGGVLPPGLSMVMNKTRTPEAILTGKQWEALYDSRGQSGDSYDIKAYGADPQKVTNDLFAKINRERRRVKRSGTVSRKVG